MTGIARGLVTLVSVAVAITGCATATRPAAGEATLSGTVTVFAAASLTDVFAELEARFEALHPGVDVAVNFGGSSGLAGQIVQGAPADVFAAADAATMRSVTGAGLAGPAEVFATNRLELVAARGADVTGLADLARPELAIALCSPEVPCGAATEALLDSAGVTARPDTLEQDVRAVLTKIELDEADAGLVYRTDALAAGGSVRTIEIDGTDAATNRYPIATLRDSGNARAAAAFVDLVLSAEGRAVLEGAGFGTP